MRIIREVKVKADEMCFVQYMPIKLPFESIKLPPQLEWTDPIVDSVFGDYFESNDDKCNVWHHKYVYLTVRHLYTTPASPGNRTGWHIDGYGSLDDNYLWCDRNPTEYLPQARRYFGSDHVEAMDRIHDYADPLSYIAHAIPVNTVVDIERDIHRVATPEVSGMRTFVKVTASYAKYNLKGNAKNPRLATWDNKHERSYKRNHPYVLDFPA